VNLISLFGEKEKHNLTCHVCGGEVFLGEDICAYCKPRLPYNDKNICLVCGRATEDSGVCMECKAHRPKVEAARSRFIYKDDIRNLILSYKNGKRYLAEYFADELVPVFNENFAGADFITFVPMYKTDQNIRGFNQSEYLARLLGERVGVEVRQFAIKKKRTERQKKLSREDRRKNLLDCFKVVDRSFKDKVVVVVDDVLTTGATADAMAVLLKDRGAKKIYAITIASVKYEKENDDKK